MDPKDSGDPFKDAVTDPVDGPSGDMPKEEPTADLQAGNIQKKAEAERPKIYHDMRGGVHLTPEDANEADAAYRDAMTGR